LTSRGERGATIVGELVPLLSLSPLPFVTFGNMVEGVAGENRGRNSGLCGCGVRGIGENEVNDGACFNGVGGCVVNKGMEGDLTGESTS
jgi:hypothetical protein